MILELRSCDTAVEKDRKGPQKSTLENDGGLLFHPHRGRHELSPCVVAEASTAPRGLAGRNARRASSQFDLKRDFISKSKLGTAAAT